MALFKVTASGELPPGSMKAFSVNGKELLLANIGGTFFATAGRCTHAGGELSKGRLEGDAVVCPKHGSKFDLKTGKALSGPKIGFLKLKTGDIVTYSVKIEGDDVMVELP